MSLEKIPAGAGQYLGNNAVKELQGFQLSIGAGAAAGTKVAVAAIRAEDTILSVIRSVAGVLTDVTSHYTIADIRASGTLTAASVAEGDTCVVDGVTYTAKATPTASTHFLIGGTDAATATNLAATINAYHGGYRQGYAKKTLKAVASSAVVTVTAVNEGTAGNSIVLTGTATRLAASGSGTLAGGSATGGVVSDTDHSATSSLIVAWYNKHA
jgi:hypothetical protein